MATLTLSAGSYTLIGYGIQPNSTGSFDLDTTGPLPPVASFSHSANGLTVDFTDTSSHGPTSWAWDFGDGNNSSAQNPQHTFAGTGSYTVCLTATNAGGSDQACQNVSVTAPVPVPTSDFTFVVNNLTVDFTDASTQSPTSWAWDFGDTATSTQQNPQHTFAGTGSYTVCLIASNGSGAGNQACQNVSVTAPVPVPTSDFTFVVNNLTVDFTDASTQSPTSWAWDFGDTATSTQQNPQHTFAGTGSYTVCLIASNGSGAGNQACQNVSVTAPVPVPTSDFTFVVNNLTVDFTDASTQSPTSWAWDFGDTATSTQQNPQHTFAGTGSYNVCLIASNGSGAGNQACQNVSVTAPVPVPTSSFTFVVNNLTVDFSDTSTQNPTGWSWDFGDGNNSSAQNPQHVFAGTGSYTVCLIASNGSGAGNQACQNVSVTAPVPVPTSSFTFVVNNLTVDFSDTSTQNPTGWSWDFGDGNNSSAQNPQHVFAGTGSYTVCLIASNGSGAGNQACQNVSVTAPVPVPTSSFTFVVNNLTVDFSDTSTQSPTGWSWDFGDGNNSSAQNPQHVFAGTGSYTVCLIASNGSGAGNQACQNVSVTAPTPVPVSDFTFVVNNLTVDFTDASSNSPTGWLWDFGDGNNGTTQNPQHVYTTAGTYPVCLMASNGSGNGNVACQNVTTTAVPTVPISNFTFTRNGLTLDFSDTSTQNPTSWAWDFGDGNTSTVQNPQNVYAAAGLYTVCLTATNNVGAGNNFCRNINVTSGSVGNSTKVSAPNPDFDGDGIGNGNDNCPYDYNPDQEDGWGSMMGDKCDTDWYNRSGIGISAFEQKDGTFDVHGACYYMADGAIRCPVIAHFNPSTFTPGEMPMDVTSPDAGTWSVIVYYLHSNNGPAVYQVNIYSTNPPQPDTLLDDRLEIHVNSDGSWQWYERGGDPNYHGI